MLAPLILITIEGLGTNLLGCYGGALSKTPNLDRFASRSIVLDQCWLHTWNIVDVLQAIGSGESQLLVPDPSAVDPLDKTESAAMDDSMLLCQMFESRGLPTRLITDAPLLDQHPFAARFTDAIVVEFESQSEAVETLEETRIAKLFQFAITKLFENTIEQDQPIEGLLWIHSKGLHAAWDAPYELRTIPCDEEDPQPSADVAPPKLRIDEQTDPDELFSVICGASAQAAAIDFAWSYINELIDEIRRFNQRHAVNKFTAADAQADQPVIALEPVVVLMGVAGYPLGEHGVVGGIDNRAYTELLHVPLIVHPAKLPVGGRLNHLIQPWHVYSMVQQAVMPNFAEGSSLPFWLAAPQLPEDWPLQHRIAWAAHGHELSLITAAWSTRVESAIILSSSNDQINEPFAQWQLFAMPDDRWQQNDIADRVEDVVDQFIAIGKLLQTAIYASAGRLDPVKLQARLEERLSPELVTPNR